MSIPCREERSHPASPLIPLLMTALCTVLTLHNTTQISLYSLETGKMEQDGGRREASLIWLFLAYSMHYDDTSHAAIPSKWRRCCCIPRQQQLSIEQHCSEDEVSFHAETSLYPLSPESWKGQAAMEMDLLITRQNPCTASYCRDKSQWVIVDFFLMAVGFGLTKRTIRGSFTSCASLTHFFSSCFVLASVCCASRHQNERRWNLLVAMTHSLPVRPNSSISGLVLLYTPNWWLSARWVWDIGRLPFLFLFIGDICNRRRRCCSSSFVLLRWLLTIELYGTWEKGMRTATAISIVVTFVSNVNHVKGFISSWNAT